MASTILGKIGGAIGMTIAGPFGAALGYTLGSLSGAAIDTSINSRVKHKITGSRLSDLAVQSSAYGRTIPIVFGKVRLAGNVIWSRPLQEREHVSITRTGKGKPRLHTTTYTYTVTLAVALCEGPIDSVINIWADAKLITAELKNFRVYKGSETQAPDHLIQSFEGIQNTPAYRGLAYVVIEDFIVTDYGNRIPNFTFEIQRRPRGRGLEGAEDLINSMCIIPGSGEFVYDTRIQYRLSGQVINDAFIQNGKASAINMNNNAGLADAVLSLGQLQDTVPNLKWAAPVVSWFATSLEVQNCAILPGVEFKSLHTTPDMWRVGKFNRSSAHQITLKDCHPIYGGTVSDASVLRYLDELRTRGLKIMFYPMVFVDLPDKPWRGHIGGTPLSIKEFFTKGDGYNQFVLHYANLVKGKVEAFIVGSELKGLTSVRDIDNSFPAVDELAILACSVKEILGRDVIVTYAADWSEYHHTDGGWYNLDKLWSCNSIDVVGIDAYFPLTSENTYPSEDEIMEGWSSGEGYDYFTGKNKLDMAYAWKNIKWWWENAHINPNGAKTTWVPMSKKIWFTEFGFPSVDASSNQPNVFYDPECVDGAFPLGSRGLTNFNLQRRCIRATLKKFAHSPMVENMFLWCWDARPYPFWPSLKHRWRDCHKWEKGHWVNGKLGLANLSDVITEISVKCGIKEENLDLSSIDDTVDGYVLNSHDVARSFIENLAVCYFFDCSESSGRIKFSARKSNNFNVIDSKDLIWKSDALTTITKASIATIPSALEIIYMDKNFSYQPNIARAVNEQTASCKSVIVESGLVMDALRAECIAGVNLQSGNLGKYTYEFIIPFKYAYLEPSDCIELNGALLRIQKLSLIKNGMLEITAVSDDFSIYDQITHAVGERVSYDFSSEVYYAIHILDLPNQICATISQTSVYIAIANTLGPFTECSIFASFDGEYQHVADVTRESVIGSILNGSLSTSEDVIDLHTTIEVSLLSGSLESIDEDGLLSGKNLVIIGEEIMQFMSAHMISSRRYRISSLLRGRMGTKVLAHKVGERFAMLTKDNLYGFDVPLHMLGAPIDYKIVPLGTDIEDAPSFKFLWRGMSLSPLSVVHLEKTLTQESILLTWVRRARINGLWRNYSDVPLDETEELYEIDAMLDGRVLETFKSSVPYIALDKKYSQYTFCVHQISSNVGRGGDGESI